ncbi:glutathione S-transferase family protein [Halomonas mongoliensis]|uniref:glutathione S-transferase family protein n=1 Tax=Halomonas mongoliensis TaxID=321265 RepID=UPI00403AE119
MAPTTRPPPRSSRPDDGGPAELIFYTHPLSRGGIVHWMLEEVGASYRMVTLEYGHAMKAPEYLAINPLGKVPAIRHGETVVTEAAAICTYLADAFPEAGLAPPPAMRGDYYRWLFLVAGPLESAIALNDLGVVTSPEQAMRLGCGDFEILVDTLAAAVEGKPYIAGDAFSAADVYVGSHIGWGMQFGTLPRRPEFEAYWAGLRERPAHRRCEAYITQLLADG